MKPLRPLLLQASGLWFAGLACAAPLGQSAPKALETNSDSATLRRHLSAFR